MYLSINETVLNKTKSTAKDSNETGEKNLLYNLKIEPEIEFSEGSLLVSGTFETNKLELGFVSLEFKLQDKIMIDLIEHGINKMNKLKNVLKNLK